MRQRWTIVGRLVVALSRFEYLFTGRQSRIAPHPAQCSMDGANISFGCRKHVLRVGFAVWWIIALGSGLRWTIDQMGPRAAARVRADNVGWLREQRHRQRRDERDLCHRQQAVLSAGTIRGWRGECVGTYRPYADLRIRNSAAAA
jgi:hypothetical protein